jgi:hypothetical protein
VWEGGVSCEEREGEGQRRKESVSDFKGEKVCVFVFIL